MQKPKIVNNLMLTLISALTLSACHYQNKTTLTVVSIFHKEGLDKNYSASYIAGINHAKETHGNNEGKLEYYNIDPLTNKINYKRIDGIIGTFSDDVYQKVLNKKVQIPLITSRNDLFVDNYDKNINYFPLMNTIHDEASFFADSLTNGSLVIYSSDTFYEEYITVLREHLTSNNKEVVFSNILKHTNTYEAIINKLIHNSESDVLLVTNKVDYTSILYNLGQLNYSGTILIPAYLAKFGTTPFNYESEHIKLLFPNATIMPLDEEMLHIRFNELKNMDKNINNYYYFRDGFLAYSLILFNKNPQTKDQAFVESLHGIYLNSEFNPVFADVFY